MRRVLLYAYSAFAIILVANYLYYNNLYNNQIQYIINLLDRQVQIVGVSVDETNNQFLTDLNQIGYNENLAKFFGDEAEQERAIEKMRLFYTKYQNFITGIKIFDTNKNEFTLKYDETNEEWLQQQFVLHAQGVLYDMERPVEENRTYEYYLPIIEKDQTIGNIAVTVDYQKYFEAIFSVFNLKDYQWQWVLGDYGEIVYDNGIYKNITYNGISEINEALASGAIENKIHSAVIGGKKKEIISSYYSTQLLQKNLGLVFTAPTDFFQKYIIRNSLFIVIGTLLLIQVIIYLFWRFMKSQKAETDRLENSEKMLFRLIEEMPVGVIIHDSNREILKANKAAAQQYAFASEEEMKGKIFPETSASEVSEYFSRNLAGNFNPEQFIVIKKEIGEVVLYRNTIPVVFMGVEALMEILIDVTMLESARKQEAKANVAKSEFLARMSYEIRTPLNGIIGMTDVLNKNDLSPQVREIVDLLRKSTEVLLSIINDILDFSKIETGKLILDEVPFNLREELSYCSDLTRAFIADNDQVTFSYSVDDNVPESIIADPFRLRQILTNLINHSARNTEKGEIRIRCRLNSSSSGIISLVFEVADTGTTFDKVTLKKIFGDYINIESKTTRNSDESGFSTILARQLIELMGGELMAECPSGLSGDKGTKVTFSINVYSNERVIKNLDQEYVTSYELLKTLAITGSQNRDEEILALLHKIGLNLTVTTFHKTTLAQVKAGLSSPDHKYRLVIIIDDEEFDGFEAARSFWENNLSGKMIVMMISSNDKKGNYLKCITLGVDHYLVKPFILSELVSSIRESFPFIESHSSSIDLSNIKKDISILVVEDNKMNQKVICTMLTSLGYECDLANDGYEGYMKAKDRKYDLIFMDLIMPEMNGYDSARKILAGDKNILIVAFTADNMPDARRKAELSGIREFISKPVRIDELKKLFAKYFRLS